MSLSSKVDQLILFVQNWSLENHEAKYSESTTEFEHNYKTSKQTFEPKATTPKQAKTLKQFLKYYYNLPQISKAFIQNDTIFVEKIQGDMHNV